MHFGCSENTFLGMSLWSILSKFKPVLLRVHELLALYVVVKAPSCMCTENTGCVERLVQHERCISLESHTSVCCISNAHKQKQCFK